MFSAWGNFAYKFRHVIPIIVIGAIVALYAVFGVQLDDKTSQDGWDDPNSQSTQAAQIEEEVFGRDSRGDVIVLVTSDNPGGAVSDATKAAMAQQLNGLVAKHQDHIQLMTSFFTGGPAAMARPDGTAAFAAIGLKGVKEEVLINYREIEEDLNNLQAPPGTEISIAGSTAIANSMNAGITRDVKRAEIVALPAVGVLLLLVFGGLIAACMPLIVGGLSILGSMGVLALMASFTQINVFAQSVVTLLGLGLAIDYGLFMVSRFREELAGGNDTPTAVRNTTATAGKTVVFSAAMVAVALSGLLIFPQAFLKSVAFGAISAVGLAALLSVAVLPSIFALLGPNIDKWAIRRRTNRPEDVMDSMWGKIPAFAMKHAKKLTFLLVVGILALAAPVVGIKLGGINETYLPPSDASRIGQERFMEEFPMLRTDPIKLVIKGEPGIVAQVYQKANEVEGLTGPFQVSQPTKEGYTVLSAAIADRDDSAKIVNYLEQLDVPGAEVLVAGTPALEVESVDALFAKLPWMLAYIVAVSFVLMALIFGSVIIPAKAVIMNILGTGATLGMLTLIFVEGFGSNLFQFTPGALMSPVLVLIIAIVFGLSTDYEVFLVSRMVEARARGFSTPEAIRFGTASTGNIITAAALIMIVVCGAFGFSSIVMMKYIAFGMVIALILDATIIRMLLVPAVMYLLREDNWWAPRWIKRASEFVGHNEKLPPSPIDRASDVPATPVPDAAVDSTSTGKHQAPVAAEAPAAPVAPVVPGAPVAPAAPAAPVVTAPAPAAPAPVPAEPKPDTATTPAPVETPEKPAAASTPGLHEPRNLYQRIEHHSTDNGDEPILRRGSLPFGELMRRFGKK